MTEPCTWCPFSACEACAYKGSVTFANKPVVWENWSGNDERPTALTVDRSSHSESISPKERAYPSW